MRARLTKLGAALAALAALAVGGSALATAAGNGSKPAPPAAASEQSAAKADAEVNDNAAEKPGTEAADGTKQADTDSLQVENGKDDATEQAAGNESETGSEAESGSEVSGNDGPGGHADEPANPNADTQQEGQN